VSTNPVSGTALATLPTTPAPSAVALATPGSVRVSWAAVPTATSYKVYRRLSTGAPALLPLATTSPFDDTGLTSGATYVYYVQAVNGVGPGAWSSPDTVVAP
jgi:hypothetical protein